MINTKNAFNGKPIRVEFREESKEWVFSVVDVCNALADSQASDKGAYWRNLKKRLKMEGNEVVSNCYELKLKAADGKAYPTDVMTVPALTALTRYIKSPHTEAFIDWLSQFDGTASRKYVLKHKDVDVVELELDYNGLISTIGQILNEAHLPVGTMGEKGINAAELKDWWKSRSIPASRERMKEFLQEQGMVFPQQLLDKSLGLSLSDQYWICPQNAPLEWAKINFFHNTFSEDVGDLLLGKAGGKDGKAVSLMSPDNTSDGILKKKWKIINGKRCLVKGGSGQLRQEMANEVLASRICARLGIPCVNYEIKDVDGEKFSVCEDFVTGDTELVAAWRIECQTQKNNNVSDYERWVSKVESLGIADVRRRIDMMLTLDFIIVNTDRHYNNFGLIRDANTLEWLSVAPIFDSGTSMWCIQFTEQIDPESRDLKCRPFNKKHNDQIKHVKDFSWLDLSKLDGIEDEYAHILAEIVDDKTLELRTKKLCWALRKRIEMLKEIVAKRQR